jgi:hypothetical protein
VNNFEMEFIENIYVPVEVRDNALHAFLIMYADGTVFFWFTKHVEHIKQLHLQMGTKKLNTNF